MDPAKDGPQIRSRIGVCPQEDTLDLEITVRDNLFVYGRYFGLPRKEVRERVDELLEFVQLTEKADFDGRGPLRRHEASADDRAQPDQPTRGAAARRADDRGSTRRRGTSSGTGSSGSSSRA